MKISVFCFLGFFLAGLQAAAQGKTSQGDKVFWREDFSSGKVPAGWTVVDPYKRGCEWMVTNQPYPGSYQYQQQAPPIASKSRGFHLQYQAGYFVDEDQASWEKKKEYPDGYILTNAIDCRDKSSVILRFQQTFRYNDYKAADSAGLFAGVSKDGIHWHDIPVLHNAPPAADMFLPMAEELNISAWAANQPRVYIRFYWRGYLGWYWMVDDIELAEAFDQDIGIVRLVSHREGSNHFTKKDELRLRIRNCGTKDIHTDFEIDCRVDGSRLPLRLPVSASRHSFAAGSEMDMAFPAIDLSGLPSHRLIFSLNYPPDENRQNDTLSIKINAEATAIGNLTRFERNEQGAILGSGMSRIRLIFYRDDIFRIWLASDGLFTDPAGNDIVRHYPADKPKVQITDQGSYYRFRTKTCVVRVYKKPLRFALYHTDDAGRVWEEIKPLVFGSRTTQTLLAGSREYFYGCGMQNGYFSHRGKEIRIEKGGGWDDGGRANPAPFYMSSAGYGVLRNTYDAGLYDFRDTLLLTHNENRFDAIYFYGPSYKEILDKYTGLTGRPFMIPRWALGLGDANCYNKSDREGRPQTTPAVISSVADKYIQYDMPRGWILPNDGYGCGYVKLDSVVKELAKRGFHTGLWTENGVDKISTEVGRYGTRLCKLDVAWVGPGYKFALDACKAAYQGIENNSDARGFVWSVMGWSGTQRYSTIWSGDQSGNWEYIRFHIPTVIGSGLSGFNAATGDVDGIFGGSDSTFTRDLQWKCFTPVLMVMSGWAKKDKQPYIPGEPFRSINRAYLDLKMQFTPYMYTYCRQAYEKGTPAVRGMVLEFPGDSVTWGTRTQYQFMLGEWLLVAPVYKSGAFRDSIYLPRGRWIDYWNGSSYEGNRWIGHYSAPLEKLPLFVKTGAILPMYPLMHYDGEKPADTLLLDIYPRGKSHFELYEDDGDTRAYQKGAYTKTGISVRQRQDLSVVIQAAKGYYRSRYNRRAYLLTLHTTMIPKQTLVAGKPLKQLVNPAEIADISKAGYFIEAGEKQGVIHIRTAFLSTNSNQEIRLIP